jgi:hypothetical protein
LTSQIAIAASLLVLIDGLRADVAAALPFLSRLGEEGHSVRREGIKAHVGVSPLPVGCAGRSRQLHRRHETWLGGLRMDRYASCAVTAFAIAAMFASSCGGEPEAGLAAGTTEEAASAATLSLAPSVGSSTNFGSALIGSAILQTYVVTNSSTSRTSSQITLSFSGSTAFSLPAPGAGGCVSGTTRLAPGASCTVGARFSPVATGPATATLSVRASVGGTASLTLTGVGLRPAALTITPGGFDFGQVRLGLSGSTVTLTVFNAGDGATSAITTVLGNASEFLVVSNTCGGSALPGAASCTINVTFRPSTVGVRSGTLTVAASVGGVAVAQLSGTGVAP